jgi:Tfp pilus assembly protein PilP
MRRPPSGFIFAFCAVILFVADICASQGLIANPGKPVSHEKSSQAVAPAVKTGAAKPAAGVDTAPPIYRYNARGKADPFKPFMETDIAVINKRAEALKKKAAVVNNRAISPLQKRDIDNFLLVGIAGDRNKKTAIVEDKAAKKHYPLFVGTYIGKNNGKVTRILADRVIVEETVENEKRKRTEKRQVNRIEMLLHKDQ